MAEKVGLVLGKGLLCRWSGWKGKVVGVWLME